MNILLNHSCKCLKWIKILCKKRKANRCISEDNYYISLKEVMQFSVRNPTYLIELREWYILPQEAHTCFTWEGHILWTQGRISPLVQKVVHFIHNKPTGLFWKRHNSAPRNLYMLPPGVFLKKKDICLLPRRHVSLKIPYNLALRRSNMLLSPRNCCLSN